MGLQSAPAYIAKQADGVTDFQHPVELMRNLLSAQSGGRSGLFKPGDFTVTSTGSGMNVSVTAGAAYLQGVESNTQGGYFAWSNAAETLTFGAASGSTRYDTILLRVADSQYGTISGSSRAYWSVVAGSPGAGAPRADSYFNTGGGSYNPGGWLRVADVKIDPGDTTIASNKITLIHRYIAGPGGKVYCLSTDRPTGYLGLRIHELDTTLEWMHDGTTWQLVGTYRQIVKLTVAGPVSFTNIPTTLRHLRVSFTAKCESPGTLIYLAVNNDFSNNYNYTLYENYAVGANNTSVVNTGGVRIATLPTNPATQWGGGVVDIHGWNSPHANYLTGQSHVGFTINASGNANNAMGSWDYHATSASYNRIDFSSGYAAGFSVGSQFVLEGEG
jgi:hypothetical protein